MSAPMELGELPGSGPIFDPEQPGLPPLTSSRPVALHDRLPSWLFYLPFVLQWAGLSVRYRHPMLPTAANPGFPLGGLTGESKADILRRPGPIAQTYIADFATVTPAAPGGPVSYDLDQVLAELSARRIGFPVVGKPSIGCRGTGVKLLETVEEVDAYLARFPAGQTALLQAFVPYEPEAGLFYMRHPDEAQGRIFSFTFKYFPTLTGDGRTTLRDLIERDPRARLFKHIYYPKNRDRLDHPPADGERVKLTFTGNHGGGAICKDASAYVTPELVRQFDRIAKDIPGFYFGRFDLRFHSLADLYRGERFKILEINGAGAEAIHIWDADTPFGEAYRTLFEQYREAFRIGHRNRELGHAPDRLSKVYEMMRAELRLKDAYPTSD